MNETQTYSIRTKDHKYLAPEGLHKITDDSEVDIKVISRHNTQGVSTSEVIINIAISFGSGIPAGIVANWIFSKLGLGRDARLYDQNGELLASVKELSERLDALTKKE